MTQAAARQVAFPQFLGRIIDSDGEPIGTCFQVLPGFLVSARHVVAEAGGGQIPPTIEFTEMSANWQASGRVARVEREDQVNDLVLLRTDQPLTGSISHLALSDLQAQNTPVWLGGYAIQQDSTGEHHYRFLETAGRWEGRREDAHGVVRGVAHANGTAKGMSGCPVVRTSDGAVIGILSHRYRGEEQWGDHRVWVSRVEDLERLCAGVATVEGDLASQVPLDRGDAPIQAADRAQLTLVGLDQQVLRSDSGYLFDPAWSTPWDEATLAVQTGKVLVLSGPPGVGTTTFAQRLLARTTPLGTHLVRLDPGDWDTPTAAALPRQPRSAYLLELRDPDSDRPTREFLHDLNLLAPWFQSMKIRLVITVADDLWRGQQADTHTHLRSVYLQHPPNPVNLARHRLAARDPDLAKVVDRLEVARHLKDRNAVQTMDAVAVVLQENERLSTASSLQQRVTNTGVASTDQPEGQPDEADQRLSVLAERVAERLDDHSDTLDALFTGTPNPARPGPATGAGQNGSKGQPPAAERPMAARADPDAPPAQGLTIEERCLLIVLAARSTARLPQLDKDGRKLQDLLGGRGSASPPPTSLEVLSGTGLRGRVNRIHARVGPNEIVTFRRNSFGPAALRYVWDNYDPIRQELARWLIDVACEGPDQQELIARRLSDLLRRHQDVGFIKKSLADIALKQDASGLLTEIVFAAVTDEHMQRRCERLLYDWAVRPDLQDVVVAVCARLLDGTRPRLALRRLRRVTDADRTPSQTLGTVLDHWRRAANDPKLASVFRQEAAAWIEDKPTRVSAKLAFTALLSSTAADGMPWLLSARPQQLPRADEMLGEVLVSVSTTPGVSASIADLVEKAAANDDLYTRTINRIVEASVANGLIRQLWDLEAVLQQVGTRTGRDPRLDIQNGLNNYRAHPVHTEPPRPSASATAAPASSTGSPPQPPATQPTPPLPPAEPARAEPPPPPQLTVSDPHLQERTAPQGPLHLHSQTPAQDRGDTE